MANQKSDLAKIKPLTIALGASVALSLASVSTAQANVFSHHKLNKGYQLADSHTGEGSCGGKMNEDTDASKAMEASCGANHHTDTDASATTDETSTDAADTSKSQEGKCGDGKCGGNM